ncbi:NB-ARC domain-containing protein [Micromonospora thermarum]|uniref:NB-ARC domain-containing protein n=1 Tax=Micromonospora thermarum TaxID=2720024 RepID=A0ABX0ZF28_9ACTN|nr:NB-ARC domain-containing protein [Micromonospora thermarum]NJP35844.1 hypothetical protein [Micromonospora thermarum]
MIERPELPPGPLRDLKTVLYELYLRAEAPTLSDIAAEVAALADELDLPGAPKRDTIGRIIGGGDTLASQQDTVATAVVLARMTGREPAAVAEQVRDLWVRASMAPKPAEPLLRGYVPPPPPLMVGRSGAVAAVLARLTRASAGQAAVPVTVVRGWPGVGKSSLAAAVVRQPAVAQAFPDGVLWAALSEVADVRGQLEVWSSLVGTGPLDATSTVAVSAAVAAALRHRRVLLVVDDAWSAADAVPFLLGGTRGAALVTTRSTEVAHQLAADPAGIYQLAVLTDGAGLELMTHLAPDVVREHRDDTAMLVRELEGLPLALQVAGRLLAAEHQLGWGVSELLAELRDGARLLAAAAPADRSDIATATTPTIAALLAKSTDRLPEEIRIRFALLGAFAERPATFDGAAVGAVWQVPDPRPTLRVLAARGLVEPTGGGRFQLHALLSMHARDMLAAA